MKFLHNIRAKSDAEKSFFAFKVAFFITLIVFVLWLVSIFSSLGDSNSDNPNVSPIRSLINSAKGIFSGSESYVSD